MKLKSVLILIIVFTSLISCKKESNTPSKEWAGDIESAGLISDFELFSPPSEAIHINPEVNDADEDGTVEHPYNSFDDITWQDNTTYAIKRGTTIKANSIVVTANGVTICSYGDGKRPVIHSLATQDNGKHALLTHWEGIEDLTIRDLEIYAPDAASSIRLLNHNKNMQVINCKLHGGTWGFRSIGTTGLLVYNTEVFNTSDDGMFIQYDRDIEIKNCYVHHVNLNWSPPSTPESEAAGDGIQLDKCNNWYVHHNEIDRMGSGNKFCFISNNTDQNDGIFEYNVLRGPEFDGYSIYIHDGSNLIFRYNYIEGPSNGVLYTHSQNLQFYCNIVTNMRGPFFASQSANVYNNLFYECPYVLQGGSITSNNNIFYSTTNDISWKVNNLQESNNLYSSNNNPETSIFGNPLFKNEQKSDFHLLEGSACIDAGKNTGLQYDFDGNSIPQGNAPDIGPYEFIK